MDRALRLSILTGLTSGIWLSLLVAGAFKDLVLSYGGSSPHESVYLSLLGFYIVSPLVGLISAIVLLFRPMRQEQRGVVGFIAFVASIPSIVLLLVYRFGLSG